MININLIAHTLGILSLVSSMIAFYPSLIGLCKKTYRQKRALLRFAHLGLMLTVCLGLIHGLLMTQNTNIDFYSINTYWAYGVGLFTFNIIVFIAFTFSELKSNFKKLNYFSYGAMLLLVFHIGQLIMPSF